MLKFVGAARDGGFDGIFAAHHYALGAGEAMFQPIPLLARLAAEAPGMTLGTSIFLLSLHNPLEAAELAATLDIISGGKFAFGVGQGYRDVEFDSFGIPLSDRGGRLARRYRLSASFGLKTTSPGRVSTFPWKESRSTPSRCSSPVRPSG